MNVCIFWACVMECMCAQIRPRFILSSERVVWEWSPNPCYSQGKNPLYRRLRGGSNPWRCITQDSEPNTLSAELFCPPPPFLWSSHTTNSNKDWYSSGDPSSCLALQGDMSQCQYWVTWVGASTGRHRVSNAVSFLRWSCVASHNRPTWSPKFRKARLKIIPDVFLTTTIYLSS